jgi:hypothetical protein
METKQWDAELKVTDTSHLEEMHKAIQALRGWPVFKREFNGVGLFTLGISIAYELERRRNHGKHDPSRYFSSITGQFEDSPKPVYEVAVGNIGTVYSGTEKCLAAGQFDKYVSFSRDNIGRAAGEDVTLFCDGEVVEWHNGVQS